MEYPAASKELKNGSSTPLATKKTTVRTGGRSLPPLCQAKIFPPRDVCPECGGEAKTAYTFSGKGEVYSFTKMGNAPAGFEAQAPYTVALIKLEEGPIVTAQLTDLGEEQSGNRHAG